MPLSDRTNVPSGTPAHHASLPCKDSLNHPRATLTLKLPKNDTELAQQLLQDPACLTRIELFYKNATPLFLLRTYLSLRCSYMDPSLQPTTSTNRKITLGFPRRQECYGTNLTSLPRSVPRIRFFKNGVPGPFLKELLEGPLINFIDDSDDVVVERNIEQKVYFQLDWPYVGTQKEWMRTYDGTSRGMLAKIIATFIHTLMYEAFPRTFTSAHFYNVHPFSPKNLPFDALRVFSVERYGEVWIPTIGLDIKMD